MLFAVPPQFAGRCHTAHSSPRRRFTRKRLSGLAITGLPAPIYSASRFVMTHFFSSQSGRRSTAFTVAGFQPVVYLLYQRHASLLFPGNMYSIG